MNRTLLRKHILPHFGMNDYFACIASSSEIADPSRGKSNPDLLLGILNYMRAKPDETIMVGDAKGDVLMAQAAKVRPVVVLTGQLTREEAQNLGVDTIINDLSELVV